MLGTYIIKKNNYNHHKYLKLFGKNTREIFFFSTTLSYLGISHIFH